MRSSLVMAGLLAVFLLSVAVPVTAQEKPLVVVFAKGMLKPDNSLKWMEGNITQVKWKIYTDTITYDEIKDASMLILVQVDTSQKYTSDEIAVIKKWFDQGGKTIWVTGDSDYKGGDYLRIGPANDVLQAVGSVLRIDNCEATDPQSNAGKPYRVIGMISPDPALKFLADGVSHGVLFHGPGPVVAYVNGQWNNLVESAPQNVYRIAWTSDQGAVAEFVKPLPKAFDVSYRGKMVLMAAEIMSNGGIVIASGEAPFDHYRGMWTPEYHDKPLSGPQFVTNTVLWGVGLKGSKPSAGGPSAGLSPVWIAVIVIVIILIIIAAFAATKKK